jgi:hypothetical protein
MTKNTVRPYMLVAIALLCLVAWRMGRAQAPQAATFSGSAAHTTCLTPAAGSYFLCVASDGIWVSNNGGAYFQLTPQASAGVTSWNGQTGAVTYAPPVAPVTSVNGKTGAVTIAATVTLQ